MNLVRRSRSLAHRYAWSCCPSPYSQQKAKESPNPVESGGYRFRVNARHQGKRRYIRGNRCKLPAASGRAVALNVLLLTVETVNKSPSFKPGVFTTSS